MPGWSDSYARRVSTVPSVEPASVTTTSKGGSCTSRLSSSGPMLGPSLRTVTTTDTIGGDGGSGGSPPRGLGLVRLQPHDPCSEGGTGQRRQQQGDPHTGHEPETLGLLQRLGQGREVDEGHD